MTDVVARCAANLRRLRSQRGISLSELARGSGVAKGTLSRIEAGQGNPTLETLWALADALGVSFGDLVGRPPEEAYLVRAGEGLALEGEAIGARMIDRLSGRIVEVHEVLFRAGHRREVAGHASGVVTHVHLVAGRLRVELPAGPVTLEERDYLRFESDARHAFEALGGEARALVLMSFSLVAMPSLGFSEDEGDRRRAARRPAPPAA